MVTHPCYVAAGCNDLKLAAQIRTTRDPRFAPSRTAIVLRSYSGYTYREEDLISIRSIIVEASLSLGGAYAVFLLVDMKDHFPGIFKNNASYAAALDATVPPELWSIVDLWDDSLLRDWYPLVKVYS